MENNNKQKSKLSGETGDAVQSTSASPLVPPETKVENQSVTSPTPGEGQKVEKEITTAEVTPKVQPNAVGKVPNVLGSSEIVSTLQNSDVTGTAQSVKVVTPEFSINRTSPTENVSPDALAHLLQTGTASSLKPEPPVSSAASASLPSVRNLLDTSSYDVTGVYETYGSTGGLREAEDTSSYEAPSAEISNASFTYTRSYEVTEGIDASHYYPASSAKTISRILGRCISALVMFLQHFKIDTYSEGQWVSYHRNDVTNEVVGDRRVLKTESPKNGHPIFGKILMTSESAKRELSNAFVQAHALGREVIIGEVASITRASSRKIMSSFADITSSLKAFFNAQIGLMDDPGRSRTLIGQTLLSALPSTMTGYPNWKDENYGDNKYIYPYITVSGIQFSQLIINADEKMQSGAFALARELNQTYGFHIDPLRLNNIRALLAARKSVGTDFVMKLSQLDQNYLADLVYGSVVPHLIQLDVDSFDLSQTAGVSALANVADILCLYVILPGIAHKLDWKFVPYLCSVMSTLDAGRAYWDEHQYSNGNARPIETQPITFYSDRFYPFCLRDDFEMPAQNTIMFDIFTILRYNGVAVNARRPWDDEAKAFITGLPYDRDDIVNPLSQSLRRVWGVLDRFQRDRANRTWERVDITDMTAVIANIRQTTELSSTYLTASGGALTEGLCSLPIVNASLMTFRSVEGATFFPPRIIRDGVPTPGFQTTIQLRPGTGLSLALCGGAINVSPAGIKIQNFDMSPEKAVRIRDAALGMFTDGQAAAMASLFVQMIIMYITNDLDTICPLNGNMREWVPAVINNWCEGDEPASFITMSPTSNDYITNTGLLGMTTRQRPKPSGLVAFVLKLVSEHFSSNLSTYITTMFHDHSSAFIERELRFVVGNDDNPAAYHGPQVTFAEKGLIECLAACFSQLLNVHLHSSRYVKGLVYAGAKEKRFDSYNLGDYPEKILWSDIIEDGEWDNGLDPADPAYKHIEYRKVYLITSTTDELQLIPPEWTDIGIIVPAGMQNALPVAQRFGVQNTIGLYILRDFRDHQDQVNDLSQYLKHNDDDPIILYMNGNVVFRPSTNLEMIISEIQRLVEYTVSPTPYTPPTFIGYDPTTLFKWDPSKVATANVHTPLTGYYFTGQPEIDLPYLRDTILHPEMAISNNFRSDVRFIKTASLRSSILAVRPGEDNSIIGTDNNAPIMLYANSQLYHVQYDAAAWTFLLEHDLPVNGLVSSQEEFANASPRLLHNLTAYNASVLQPALSEDVILSAT